MILFQAAVAQKKAVGHADRAVVIPGYSFVSIHNCTKCSAVAEKPRIAPSLYWNCSHL